MRWWKDLSRGKMTCLYFTYQMYCEKDYMIEKQTYGYADLTEYKCPFKEKQEICKCYIQKSEKIEIRQPLISKKGEK